MHATVGRSDTEPIEQVPILTSGCPGHGLSTPATRTPIDIPKDRALFWEDEDCDTFVLLVDGIVRACRLSPDGTRQILSFFFPGDIVGLDRVARHLYTAEAVTACRVIRFKRRSGSEATPEAIAADLAAHWGDLVEKLLGLVALLAQKTVTSRVAWFLLELRRFLVIDGPGMLQVRFDIPRADIADHLGTSVETVCRCLTEFRDRGLIDMPNRRTLVIADLAALQAIARGRTVG